MYENVTGNQRILNMENIKLILDSSSNMETNEKENLQVVPLTISLGVKTILMIRLLIWESF